MRPDDSGYTRRITIPILHVEAVLNSDGNPFLLPGQTYNIHLEMNMPESDVNYNAGAFVVSTYFYDKVGCNYGKYMASKPPCLVVITN